MKKKYRFYSIAVTLIYLLILSACFRNLQPEPGENGSPGFIPPTISIPTITPTPTIDPAVKASSTPALNCENNLSFLKDETVPDGTLIQPGASIDKRWEVQNTGTCNWSSGYTIRLIGGSELGAAPIQDLFPARSDNTITIRIEFIAPNEEGNYRSAWQAFSPDEIAFGDPFYIDIIVGK
jgi:hypothetical protein